MQKQSSKTSIKEVVFAGKCIFGISLTGLIIGVIGLIYSYNMNWVEMLYLEKWKGINPINISWLVILVSTALVIFSKNLTNKDKQNETEDFIAICDLAMKEVSKAYSNK